MRTLGTLLLLCSAAAAWAQPKRVLYLTHSAGFRHGSIEVSRQVLAGFAGLEVVATEDLAQISADNLDRKSVV